MLLDCLSPFNSYFVAPSLRPMLGPQVFVGAHLLQSRNGSLELKTQPRAVIERLWRAGCGGDQLDIAIVKLIDQINETSGCILFIPRQDRNLLNQDRMVFPGQFHEISGTARLVA